MYKRNRKQIRKNENSEDRPLINLHETPIKELEFIGTKFLFASPSKEGGYAQQHI